MIKVAYIRTATTPHVPPTIPRLLISLWWYFRHILYFDRPYQRLLFSLLIATVEEGLCFKPLQAHKLFIFISISFDFIDSSEYRAGIFSSIYIFLLSNASFLTHFRDSYLMFHASRHPTRSTRSFIKEYIMTFYFIFVLVPQRLRRGHWIFLISFIVIFALLMIYLLFDFLVHLFYFFAAIFSYHYILLFLW
jgi:hypothetical protein